MVDAADSQTEYGVNVTNKFAFLGEDGVDPSELLARAQKEKKEKAKQAKAAPKKPVEVAAPAKQAKDQAENNENRRPAKRNEERRQQGKQLSGTDSIANRFGEKPRNEERREKDENNRRPERQENKREFRNRNIGGGERRDTREASNCFNCGQPGHLSKECQQERKPREPREPQSCYNCGQPGHLSKDCQQERKVREPREPQVCFNCQGTGHISKECPEPREPRQRRERNFEPSDREVDESAPERRSQRRSNNDQRPARGRQHDRISGSDQTGVKAVPKKGGHGKFNTGTTNDEIAAETEDNQPKTDADESQQQPLDQENAEDVEAKEEEKKLTLEEWKAQQQKEKVVFNTRRANEGTEKLLQKFVPLKRDDAQKEEDEDQSAEEETLLSKRAQRSKVLPIEVNFNEPNRNNAGPAGGRRDRDRNSGAGRTGGNTVFKRGYGKSNAAAGSNRFKFDNEEFPSLV